MRFLFVHGGFYGAWCWSRTIDEIERLGHEGVAVDLPGHGDRRDETAPTTFAGRTGAIVAALRPGDVLVGHSGGGFDITHAADARPELVSHVCYLAGGLPRQGRTWPEAMALQADGTMGDFDVAGMLQYLEIDADGAMFVASAEGARALFFHDCDDETVRWAFERLCKERAGETSTVPVDLERFWSAELPLAIRECAGSASTPGDRGGLVHRGDEPPEPQNPGARRFQMSRCPGLPETREPVLDTRRRSGGRVIRIPCRATCGPSTKGTPRSRTALYTNENWVCH